tara:strand:- start:135 stop:374 length:240 start_codon:yes stop_codon:yes gene_type:complete
MNDQTILARFGGRKFLLAVAIVIAACVLVAFERIGEQVWSVTVLGALGAFAASNAAVTRKGIEKPALIEADHADVEVRS